MAEAEISVITAHTDLLAKEAALENALLDLEEMTLLKDQAREGIKNTAQKH